MGPTSVTSSLPVPSSAPPIPPPPLPPFPSLITDDEQQPQRGEDYDSMSHWARALSTSPRLYPTSSYGISSAAFGLESGANGVGGSSGSGGASGTGNHASSNFASYKGLGEASPMLEARPDSIGLSVGTGLSPLLGPTHLGGMGSMGGEGYDYSFNGSGAYSSHHHHPSARIHLHSSPPTHPQQTSPQSHPLSHSHSNSGSAHSFSNLERHRSMSPQALPPPLVRTINNSSTSKSLVTSTSSLNLDPVSNTVLPASLDSRTSAAAAATPAITTSPLSEMTEGRMSSISELVPDEDPRIRAYAKLEFQNFDMYIQKLSVIIGRRPAAIPPAPKAPSAAASPIVKPMSPIVEDSKSTDVKLEDFVRGLVDDDSAVEAGDVTVDGGFLNSSVAMANGNVAGAKRKEEIKSRMIVVKKEVEVPILSLTPSSQPGSPSDTTAFLQFSNSTAATPPIVESAQLSFPPFILEPAHAPIVSLAVEPVVDASASTSHDAATAAATSATAAFLALDAALMTDIDLGPIRAVSRQHARLYFDYDLGGWAIEVLGRNGVVVEGTWKAKGERESLGKRTKIQIAERIFHFVLPTIEVPTDLNLAHLEGSSDSLSDLDDEDSLGDGDEDEEEDDDNDSSSLSEMSDSDIELSPLMQPTDAGTLQAIPPLRLSLNLSRMSNQGNEVASTSRSTYNLSTASNGGGGGKGRNVRGSGKNVRAIEAVRSGGKGKGSGKAKGGKAKSSATALTSGGKGKGKGKSVYKKPGKLVPVSMTVSAAKKLPRSAASIASKSTTNDPFDSESELSELEDDEGFGSDSNAGREAETGGTRMSESYAAAVAEPTPDYVVSIGRRGIEPRKAATAAASAIAGVAITEATKVPVNFLESPPRSRLSLLPILASPSRLSTSSTPLSLPLLPKSLQTSASTPLASSSTSIAGSTTDGIVNPADDDKNAIRRLEHAKRGRGRPPKNGIAPLRRRRPPGPKVFGPPNNPALARPQKQLSIPSSIGSAAHSNAVASGSALLVDSAPIDPLASSQAQYALPVAEVKTATKTSLGAASKKPAGVISAVAGVSTSTMTALRADGREDDGEGEDDDDDDETPRDAASPSEPIPYPAGTSHLASAAPPPDEPFAKPPYTYASLIAQAVSSVDTKKLTLNGIYDWITTRWPYFSDNQNGWQNSIRHNLTLPRGFMKIPRRPDEPGKGAFWSIDPGQLKNFDGLNFRKKLLKVPFIGPRNDPSLPPKPKPIVPKVNVLPKVPIAPKLPKSIAAVPVGVVAGLPKYRPTAITSAASSTSSTGILLPAGTSAGAPRHPTGAPPAPRPNPASAPAPPRANPAPSLSAPLPIIVAPIPASYVRPPLPPSSSTTPPDDLTAALLRDPPIVLHEGKLILNPTIFQHLSPAQLANLQTLPASSALQVLQAFVVRHFKEKMKRANAAKAAALAAAAAASGGAGAAGGGGGVIPATAGASAPAVIAGAGAGVNAGGTGATNATTAATTIATPGTKRKIGEVDVDGDADDGIAKSEKGKSEVARDEGGEDSDVEIMEAPASAATVAPSPASILPPTTSTAKLSSTVTAKEAGKTTPKSTNSVPAAAPISPEKPKAKAAKLSASSSTPRSQPSRGAK